MAGGGWWGKIERVVAYKQKVEGDVARRRTMDRRLIFLVKRTEEYGKTLLVGEEEEAEEEDDPESNSRRRRRPPSHPLGAFTCAT